jgi:hypothetical protein
MYQLIIALLLLVTIGCGSGQSVSYTDNSKDPEAFALTVKQMTLDAIEDAKSARDPADKLRVIVSTFESRLDSGLLPVGGYKDIYDELYQKANALFEACDQVEGRTSDLNSRLEEIKLVADRLPGNIKASVEPRR